MIQPNSIKTYFWTFVVGGIIGTITQVLFTIYIALGVPEFYQLPAVILTIALMGGILAIAGIFAKLEGIAGMGAMMGMSGLAAGIAEGIAAVRSQGGSTGEVLKAGLLGPAKIFGVGITCAVILGAVKMMML